MSTADNKAVYQGFITEVFNNRQLDRVEEFVAPDAVFHNAPPGLPPGAAGVKILFAAFQATFPDMIETLDQVIVEGDTVAARSTLRGTHQGEFMGLPATEKAVTISGFDMVRVADGKIVEHWGMVDMFSLMQQLGAG